MSDMLQNLYDSEINFMIFTFWDGGFDWRLGDKANGYKEEGCADTYAKACEELYASAIRHFPNSRFAKEMSIRCQEGRIS